MRLDHVSYVASHDQISDVVNRIGSQIGTAFIDGGIHPKFGTRNFTAPLLNGQYIEVVCPLDHPATDATPFGQAVKKKAEEGGGWLTWVLSTNDITLIEKRLGRNSVSGLRKKPDGSELNWKQIGVLATLEDSQLPFFVEWISDNHPSGDGTPVAKIERIELLGEEKFISNWIDQSVSSVFGEVEMVWETPVKKENRNGMLSIDFNVQNKIIKIE
jgi:hypothetical protein